MTTLTAKVEATTTTGEDETGVMAATAGATTAAEGGAYEKGGKEA